jgi:hypothetical protein
MKSEVDQFGRTTNTSKSINEDKSQRILEALSDIKNQLQNEEFTPKDIKEKSFKSKETKQDDPNNLDFKDLQEKIENLEKKINQIFNNLENKNNENSTKNERVTGEEISVFHQT